MYQEFSIEILGLKITGIKSGNAHGPTVIALHGWLDNCLSFQPLLPYLQDFNVIAVDFSGHGLSDYRSKDCYLHFIDYVHDLAFIFQKLELTQAMLLGHSLGGSIAALFAGLFPHKVQKLFLLDSLGPVVAPVQQQLEMMRTANQKYLSASLGTRNLKVFASHAEAQNARGQVTPMHAESLKLLVSRSLKKVPGGWSWRTDPRLLIAPNTAYSEENVTSILAEIICPTSLLIPENGCDYGATFFPRRQSCIKQLVTHHVPGTHHAHMDSPHIVGQLIQDFFTASK